MKARSLKILEISFVKTRSDSVKARVDIHFEGFTLKGFKVLQDEGTKRYFLTPPSYLSPKGWRKLFKTDHFEDWQEIQRCVLERFDRLQMEEAAEAIRKEED